MTQHFLDEAFAEQMSKLAHSDIEASHSMADALLVRILRDLGFNKTADAFDALDKWYA